MKFFESFLKSSYLNLPQSFFSKELPDKISKPFLIKLNYELAKKFGLNISDLESEFAVKFFSGNYIPEHLEPISMVYAGHQFGHFSPQLGDGRAILLAEIADQNNQKFDVQLKGSGKTKYSRRGDGKSALGPVIREYLISEAMHYLGIATTRSLAIVKTNEFVMRDQLMPAGILTRVAASHIRIGTFEYFASLGDVKSVKILADYAIKRHYPKCFEAKNHYLELLKSVIEAQAKLICDWMRVGFVHGVMNSDNMAISGETIDYGPCAFLDNFDLQKAFSAIDANKRYAFGNQPAIASWNLTRFAESLLPLLDENIDQAVVAAEKELEKFGQIYQENWTEMMRKKMGLVQKREEDLDLFKNFLQIIQSNKSDYTQSFRYLSGDDLVMNFAKSEKYLVFEKLFAKRLSFENMTREERLKLMNLQNPIYIPRNHIVEDAIAAAIDLEDFSKMDDLLKVVKNPYQKQQNHDYYSKPPKEINLNYQTFCGT